MKQQDSKLHKAVNGASIAVKVVFALCGVVIFAFLSWLGFSIYTFLGV